MSEYLEWYYSYIKHTETEELAKNELESAHRKIKHATEQLAKAKEDYKTLFSAFESCQEDLKESNERENVLSCYLDSHIERVAELEIENNRESMKLRSRLGSALGRNSEYNSAIENMQQKLAKANEEIENLNLAFIERKALCRQAFDANEKQIEVLQEKLAKANERVEELEKELTLSTDQNDLLLDEFIRVKHLTDNTEIHALCGRAHVRMRQNVSVIDRNHQLERKVAELKNKVNSLENSDGGLLLKALFYAPNSPVTPNKAKEIEDWFIKLEQLRKEQY